MRRNAGFTLLEVLVAFTIAAMAAIVLFKTAGIGLVSTKVAGRYEEATSRARSHLEALGQDARPIEGELRGDDGDGYRWRLAMVPVGTTKPPRSDAGDDETARPAPPGPLTLYAVTVGISWSENGRTREVVLHTQRLGHGPRTPDE
jgi:general secretion pathway protein I